VKVLAAAGSADLSEQIVDGGLDRPGQAEADAALLWVAAGDVSPGHRGGLQGGGRGGRPATLRAAGVQVRKSGDGATDGQ
jgi:hypothetical protein